MELPKEAEDLKLCLCSLGVKSSEIKPGANPKCVFCAMRSYGYYTEYKLAADRKCDTVRAKDSDSFQDRLMLLKSFKCFIHLINLVGYSEATMPAYLLTVQ